MAETWDEIHCPHCGSTDWYTLDAGSHHCRGCNKDFGCAARAEGEPPQGEVDFGTPEQVIAGLDAINKHNAQVEGEQAAPGLRDSASIAAFAIEDVDRVMWTKAMPIDDAIDLMRAALTAPVPLAHDFNCEYSKWGTKCTCASPVKDGRQETPK